MEQEDIEFSLEIFYEGKLLKKCEKVKSCDVVQYIISKEHNITERATIPILKNRDRQELNIMNRYFIPESDFKIHKYFLLHLTRIK